MGYPMLRLNDGSDDTSPQLASSVMQLQTALTQAGYPLHVDGIFGEETQAAVMQFQLVHNLYNDGVVGPITWAVLMGQAAPSSPPAFSTTLTVNDSSMLAQLQAAETYRNFIVSASNTCGVPPALIAGIGSRESGWGLLLKPTGPTGTGDFASRSPKPFRPSGLPLNGGFGRGLMQIDFDAFEFARTGNWQDPQANIAFGCNVLQSGVALLQRKTSLSGQQLLQAATAAYNCGAGNVLQAIADNRDLDFYTAGRNYSADVFNRAGFFEDRGW